MPDGKSVRKEFDCFGSSASLPKIYFGTHSLARFEPGSVITIGAFDGVHCGHQSVIARLREKSLELGVPAVAVTFYPEPAQYFQPEVSPPQIMSWREKALALLDAGVDAVVCLQFNEAMRSMSAREFGQQVLSENLGAKFVIVGDDFRFGIGREGDFDSLVKFGQEFEFSVEQAATHEQGGERISSTRVRQLLAGGNLLEAAELLGRPYEASGRIIRGHQLGRTLGFPTANVPLKRSRIALSGVYAVTVKAAGKNLYGAANIGYRPAVNSLKKPLLEVHLFDFDEEIYGERICVRFQKKLREETDFDDLDGLKDAIAKDIDNARDWFAENPNLL